MAESKVARKPVDSAVINSLLTHALEKALLGSLLFIPGMVVFRRPALRWLSGGIGIGFGLGQAWTQGDLWLRHPEMVSMPVGLAEEAQRIQEWVTKQIANLTKSE
mmetsp:Transcript_8816/g.15838  ORF Transcript_8816/g.15838 Transcript_8816/m.15838 type:complete len:105 (-) Transcript_8816:76-390(-)